MCLAEQDAVEHEAASRPVRCTCRRSRVQVQRLSCRLTAANQRAPMPNNATQCTLKDLFSVGRTESREKGKHQELSPRRKAPFALTRAGRCRQDEEGPSRERVSSTTPKPERHYRSKSQGRTGDRYRGRPLARLPVPRGFGRDLLHRGAFFRAPSQSTFS